MMNKNELCKLQLFNQPHVGNHVASDWMQWDLLARMPCSSPPQDPRGLASSRGW